MDADLQHPPTALPAIIDSIDPCVGASEFVIGTAYEAPGRAHGRDRRISQELATEALNLPLTGAGRCIDRSFSYHHHHQQDQLPNGS